MVTNASDNGVSGGAGTPGVQFRGLLGIVVGGGDALHHTMTRLIPAVMIDAFLKANMWRGAPLMEESI